MALHPLLSASPLDGCKQRSSEAPDDQPSKRPLSSETRISAQAPWESQVTKSLLPKSQNHTEGNWVKLPDLFTSIMSKKPVVNANEAASKVASDKWLKTALCMSNETAHKWDKLDIAYMNAILAPTADVETLTLINDWNGWVFAFDDQFDEGHLQSDLVQAAQEIVRTVSLLDNISPIVTPDQSPLQHTLQSCWLRYQRHASPDLQYRWKQHLMWYCLGVLRQVGAQAGSYNPTVEEYMDFRSGSVGGYPCIGLMEYAYGINLPHSIVEHASLKEIARLTCDLITLQNDVCSYRKDLEEGGETNIILLLKREGLTDQQAMDKIGQMVEGCYERWHDALGNLPLCNDETHGEVMRYIDGCQNVALSNLHWSFHTARYLKDEGRTIMETRMMRLP